MSTATYRAIPRLVVAIVGHLFLFAWFHELGTWRSLEHQAWKSFRLGSISILVLVCAVSVMIRGSSPEKVAGFILCLLPALVLIGAMVSFAKDLF
jgi:hypothetical protein